MSGTKVEVADPRWLAQEFAGFGARYHAHESEKSASKHMS